MSDLALEPDGSIQLPEGDTAPQDPAPNTVPVERFNGLQRKLQEVIRERDALKATAPQTPAETPAVTPQPEESGVEDWLAELMEERMENWRDKAIEAYPQVAPLREYLTANSRAGVMELAKDLAEKLGGTTPPSEEAPTVTATTPTPAPPAVTGGSPALPPPPSDDEELAELRKRAARTNSNADYSAYLRKKYEMEGLEYPG